MSESRLHVLMVADVSPLQSSGGSARVLREQTIGLRARGHGVSVLCRHPGGDVPARAELAGAPVVHYPVKRTTAFAYARTSVLGARKLFRRLLREQTWDAVLFHQPFSAVGVQSQIARRVRRIYCFYSPAGVEYRLRAENPQTGRTPPGTNAVAGLMAWLERRALAGCHQVVVLSNFSRRVLEEAHGRAAGEVKVIPGGVDLEHFRPAADRIGVRRTLGLPAEIPLLLTVRDLEPRMGVHNLLRALAVIEKDRPLFCVIGGTGPLRPFLEDQAARLGVSGRVRFTGHIPEEKLPRYYQAADLFVLPTRAHEGFGLVTVEALACGTPVAATPVGATPEILDPLDSRLLASDATVEGLTRNLIRTLPLAMDPNFRHRCRSYVEGRYSWHRHLDILEKQLRAGLKNSDAESALSATGPDVSKA
ncbi:MAG: glycosyltransferase family 4 protein [Acidobacteriota bacterium]